MNLHLKAIILKEVKEVSGRYLLNIIPFIVLAFVTVVSSTGLPQKLIMELSFILVPSFAMLILGLPFIQEKFDNEKLLRRFESILTTPISLKTVWAGKMTSIFLLSYPGVIIITVILLFLWNILNGTDPISIISAPVWVMTLVIAPLIPLIYYGFSSWSVLRFTHPKIMQILLYLGIAIGLLVYVTSNKIIENMDTGQIVNWSIIAYSIIGIVAAASLLLLLINRLEKEKVTI